MELLQNLKNKYLYKVYGLVVCSELEIEELPRIEMNNI